MFDPQMGTSTPVDEELDPTEDETGAGGPPPSFFAQPPAQAGTGALQVTTAPSQDAPGMTDPTLSRVGGGSVYSPDDEAIVRAAYLKRLGISPGEAAASSPLALSTEDAKNTALRTAYTETPQQKLGHQYDEIMNEAQAGSDAANGPGATKAAALLKQVMASRQGLAQAGYAAQLSPEGEAVRNEADQSYLARQQPKIETATQADAIKLQIAQMQQAGKLSAAEAAELGRTADALYGGMAHIAGSGYGTTEPGQATLSMLQQALAARQGGAGGAGGTPQYKVGQYAEGQTGSDKAGAKYVWHNAGAKGPNWYPQ